MDKTGLTVENYISNEYSVCREERQYALFLNNILLKYRRPDKRSGKAAEIFKACGLSEAEVLNVFYEATFMRDIFERNRRINLSVIPIEQSMLNKKCSLKAAAVEQSDESFNSRLIKYVTGRECKVDEVNLGRNEIACDIDESSKRVIQSMMNSKPDIAVIYEQNEQKYLQFIECKFESSEGSDKGGNKQRKIQWMIADFLRRNNYLKELKISDNMASGRSCLVQFTRKLPKDNEICIKDLIDLNNEIFFGQK